MADGVRVVADLDDPVGEELERKTLASGLDLRKVRVPLGVVAVVYEARPNVTIDCAALTIKSGNAIVLRGSSYAERSNGALAAVVREALAEAGLPEDAVQLLAGGGREGLAELATQERLVDLLIPRGGEGLKAALKDVATVPVMYAAAGNCHVYVHADADLEMARRIAVNAKTQRPGVCNAAETLLVDAAIADASCPPSSPTSPRPGSSWSATSGPAPRPAASRSPRRATEDFDDRVPRPEAGRRRRRLARRGDRPRQRNGTRHSEAIVTGSARGVRARSSAAVDAAVVYINASTRFTDGFEFGMGAEIGNSTQKLHARGPIGLRELTTYKYVVRGDGQVRE